MKFNHLMDEYRPRAIAVNAEQEDEGLDVAEHGESAYALD